MKPAEQIRNDHGQLSDEGRIAQAVEAMIFTADAPLRPEEAALTYRDVTGNEITADAVEEAVNELNSDYRERETAFRIEKWGGGYRLATITGVAPFVKAHYAKEEAKRLTRALLETLAVVAYKQPVTKPEIDHVRGVNADYAIRQLLERELISVVGRAETIGTPLLYGTTDAFFDLFGLESIEHLPKPREVEEILADPLFNKERAVLFEELNQATPQSHAGEKTGENGQQE